MNLGHVGQRNHPEVVAAQNKVFKLALEMGVAPRAEIGTPDQAKEYLDMGVRHFSIGADMQILFDYWKNTGAGLREVLEGSS